MASNHRITRNANGRGMLSTLDLHIEVAWFVIKVNYIFNIKSSLSRRSTLLSLPLRLGFPAVYTEMSWSRVFHYLKLKKLASDEHLSLLRPFVYY
jgi:hypothetical protein